MGEQFFIILQGSARVIIEIKNGDQSQMVTVAKLNEGMSFGELALIKSQPRAASIQCINDCHFAVLGKNDYMKIIGRAEAKALDRVIEFLSSIPFFNKWGKKKLSKLTYYLEKQKFIRKKCVFESGSPANFVYIVKSGEFELTKPLLLNDAVKRKNFNLKVALLSTGEIFCEDEVMGKTTNKFTCTCYSAEGELYMIPANSFHLIFSKSGEEALEKSVRYYNRETRISSFRNFFQSKTPDFSLKPLKKSFTPALTHGCKKRSESESYDWKFTALSKSQLKYIRQKALGKKKLKKMYIKIHSQIESLPTEANQDFDTEYQTETIPYKSQHVYRPRIFKNLASFNLMFKTQHHNLLK